MAFVSPRFSRIRYVSSLLMLMTRVRHLMTLHLFGRVVKRQHSSMLRIRQDTRPYGGCGLASQRVGGARSCHLSLYMSLMCSARPPKCPNTRYRHTRPRLTIPEYTLCRVLHCHNLGSAGFVFGFVCCRLSAATTGLSRRRHTRLRQERDTNHSTPSGPLLVTDLRPIHIQQRGSELPRRG